MVAVSPDRPFIGRTRELNRLHALRRAAADGTAAAVLLSGDAGVGKTSLAAEFGRQAQADGSLVLLGHNVELGTGGLPYLPFAEALSGAAKHDGRAADVVLEVASRRPVLARLTGLATGGDATSTDLDRLALFEAVAEVLGKLAEAQPVVLVVEDLHWAEQSSRDLLRFLLSRIGAERLLVVVTYRSEDLHRRHPVRALLAELLRLPAVELIEVRPFDDAELGAFLTSVQGTPVERDVVQSIRRRSAGNAYFAEELLTAGDGDRLPTALADILLDRLERLPAATQQLVRVAAVIGPFRIEDGLLRATAVAGAGMSEVDADAALRDAVTHHALIPDDNDRFGFRHALLQEAVYSDLLPGERVRLHAAVADQLACRDAGGEGRAEDAAELARHSMAAHDLPRALDAAWRAATEALRRLAPAEALAQYDLVLELWPVVPPERRPPGDVSSISVDASLVAETAGQRDRAVALAEDAVRLAQEAGDRAGVHRARARLARHLFTMERTEEARTTAYLVIADFAGALDGVTTDEPTEDLVLARAMAARAWQSFSEPERALEQAEPGLEEARKLGLKKKEADILLTLANIDAMLGRPHAERHLAAARAAAEAAGDRETLLRVNYSTAVDRFEEGDLDAAFQAIHEALDAAEREGLANLPYAVQSRWMLVHAHWMSGDPEAALAVVDQGIRTLPPLAASQLEHASLPIRAVRTPAEVLSLADQLDGKDWSIWNLPARWAARAEAHFWLGDLDRSIENWGQTLDALEQTGEPYQLSGIAYSTNAVGALADRVARGDDPAADVEAARRFVDDARERAKLGRPRRFTMGPEGVAWLARLDAEEARLTGTDTAAAWEGAVAAFDTFGSRFEAARGRWRWAQRLLADGDRDAARTQVTLARDLARPLGAVPLLEALDDLARRGRLDAQPSRLEGRLTSRELDVMRLVAQGLTNRVIGERLFISEKTVSVHVSNVLGKLDASGRAEAVAIATREGLLD